MRIKTLFIISFIIFLNTSIFTLEEVNASTHELEALDIHVFIEEDGSAVITEKRLATLSEGTENYIVIGNLGESTITDFQVYEDGKWYDYVEDWDVDGTREEKAFKNGVIEEKEHDELVWGIGEFGKHEYELTYTVTDFIKQLEDSQMIFWQFVNSDTNIPPQNVTVTIETDKPLNDGSERIWAFGFEGDIHFEDGTIVAKSNSPLSESDYVTILTEFSNSNFGTNDVIDQTFEEVKEEAFEGSDYTKDDSIGEIIAIVLIMLVSLGGIVISVFLLSLWFDKKKRKKYEGKYFREVPYDDDFFMAYGLLTIFQLSNLNHLLSAFILKWMKEERIRVVLAIKKGIFREKEVTEIHLAKNGIDGLKDNEAELFDFFVRASTDGVLRQDDFRRWSSKNHKLVSKWEEELMEKSLTKSEEEGFLKRKESKAFGESYKKNIMTTKTEQFKDNVYMFENYLNDFSLLNEHEPVNVKLWDELMIWAALLGITTVVYKEFKELYPEYEQESAYSFAAINTATAYARSMNSVVSSDRSSGSGGAASFGGGGGSFGGGSGGGTR